MWSGFSLLFSYMFAAEEFSFTEKKPMFVDDERATSHYKTESEEKQKYTEQTQEDESVKLTGFHSPVSAKEASWPLFPEVSYKVGSLIGEGASASVYKAQRKSSSGYFERDLYDEPVALKVFNSDGTGGSNAVRNEICILQHLSKPEAIHPNIITLKEVITTTPGFATKTKRRSSNIRRRRLAVEEELPNITAVAMEMVEGVELYDMLPTTTGRPLSLQLIKSLFQQMARAVHHMHENNIVHLDLKPENILVKRDGSLLVTDFGFAQFVKPRVPNVLSATSTVSPEEKEPEFQMKRFNSAFSTSSTSTALHVESDGISPESFKKKHTLSEIDLSVESGSVAAAGGATSMRILRSLSRGQKLNKELMHRAKSTSILQEEQPRRKKTLLVASVGGTVQYKAPETLTELPTGMRLNVKKHDERMQSSSFTIESGSVCGAKVFDGAAADIWSLGVVLYCLYFGKEPTREQGGEIDVSFDLLEEGWATPKLTTDAGVKEKWCVLNLLDRMMVADPEKRMSISEVCAHPWVRAGVTVNSSARVSREVKELYSLVQAIKKQSQNTSPLARDDSEDILNFLSTI